MKKLMFIAMLLLSTFASASDYLYLGAWSHHLNQDHPKSGTEEIAPPANHPCWKLNQCVIGSKYVEYEYNESHDLIGYQRNGLLVAHYKNSFNQSTVLVANSFESQYKDLKFILALGATHGYTDCGHYDDGKRAKLCAHYQAGIAYTKYKVEPVISLSATVFSLTFRVKI
jgi:hypothetical protein